MEAGQLRTTNATTEMRGGASLSNHATEKQKIHLRPGLSGGNFSGWSAEETEVQVELTLEGKVLQVLVDLQPEEQVSWPALNGALRRCFGKRVFADDACGKLAV